MANIRTFKHSFAGGEVSPELFGRIDDAKFQAGLALCRNFIAKPQGAVENRAGFAFVREVKDSAKRVRLIPFTYSTTQTMVLELGAGYFRFHTQGETLLNSTGAPYEIANPYAEQDLFDIHYVQSADVLTMVHPNYPPSELRRYGATNWTFTPISFTAPISSPLNVTATPSGNGATDLDYYYVVTAITADGVSESAQSAQATCKNNLFTTGNTNTISWDAVPGAARYMVYKMQGGLFGYIGQTDTLSLVDNNIAADLSKTPPIYDSVFLPNGILSVPVISGGSGYGSLTTGGNISSVTVVNGGSGYLAPILTLSDPTGNGASLGITVSGGVITSASVIVGGAGYTNPSISITDSAGNGAILSATVTPLTSSSPTLQVTDPTGSGAVLTPIIQDGVVVAVNVIDPGANYTNPVVSFADPAGGSGAVFGTPVLTGLDYPGAVSYFEQRRCFAGTTARPQNIWMTRSGTESDMSYSLPTRDDDRVAFRVAAREANTIRHIVPLTELLLLTSSAEWRVTSVNSDAITPSTISVRPQSYVGASDVQPVTVNNTCLYGAARGGHVRELAYSWQANGFVTGDLCLRAPHLFDNYDLVDMAYAKAPLPIIWFVSTTGKLLGLTYVPDQQVGSWHQHDTDGAFESCAAVAEGKEDMLYCVINRTLGGRQARCIERKESRQFVDPADAFFVDCGVTRILGDSMEIVIDPPSQNASTIISNLQWLEGKTVSILGDGAVFQQKVVTNGQIKLDGSVSKAQIGLPITADMQTLPFAAQIDGGFGNGRPKNVNKGWLRVYRSTGIWIGPDVNHLTMAKPRSSEPYGMPPDLKSEEIGVMLTPSWADSGQVFVRQTDPVPLTIVSMTTEVSVGG